MAKLRVGFIFLAIFGATISAIPLGDESSSPLVLISLIYCQQFYRLEHSI